MDVDTGKGEGKKGGCTFSMILVLQQLNYICIKKKSIKKKGNYIRPRFEL